jgi:hypothetical protein
MPPYASLQHHMAPYGSIWLPMVPYGSIWFHIWLHMAPFDSIWLHMVPYGSLWLPMAPFDSHWIHMVPYGSLWLLIALYGSSFRAPHEFRKAFVYKKLINNFCWSKGAIKTNIYHILEAWNSQNSPFYYRSLDPMTWGRGGIMARINLKLILYTLGVKIYANTLWLYMFKDNF